jgi:hypothetical protein
MADSASASSFIFGLGSALAAFLATTKVDREYQARRFRERIKEDIQETFRNYLDHRPVLKGDYAKLKKDLTTADKNTYEYKRIIWSNSYTLLPHIIENSAFLRAPVFKACVDYYDNWGRLEEIRKAHNESASRAACSSIDREQNLDFALYCLQKLSEEYEFLLDAGYTALRLLWSNYPSIEVDQNLLARWEEEMKRKQRTAETGVLTATV